jgi:hypothetical protein
MEGEKEGKMKNGGLYNPERIEETKVNFKG